MEGNPVDAAVGRVRSIADPERRMIAAQDLLRDYQVGESSLVDIRSEAAQRLRDADRKRWTYERIATACGLTGDYLRQKGRAIVKGSRRRQSGAD